MQLIYTIAGVDNGTIFTLKVFQFLWTNNKNEKHEPKRN